MTAEARKALPATSRPWEGTQGRELRSLIHLVRKRWWLMAVCGLLAASAAWWLQRGQLPKYTAEILLQQRTEVDAIQALNLGTGADQDFGAQLEIIRSRTVLSKVVDSLDLLLELDRPEVRSRLVRGVEFEDAVQPGAYLLSLEGADLTLRSPVSGALVAEGPASEPVAGPGFLLDVGDPEAAREPVMIVIRHREDAIDRLRAGVLVEPGLGISFIRVSHTGFDPGHVAAVVNTVGWSYQTHRAETARDAAANRRSVIAGQLVALADSLQQLQGEVLAYQERQQLLNPDVEGNALLTAVLQTETELRRMRFEESLLESVALGLQSDDFADANIQRIVGLGSNLVPGGDALYGRLQDLEAERSRLTVSRFGFTAQDPQVEVQDSLIASTKADLRVTVVQALELFRARVASEGERLSGLRAQVGQLPSRAGELDRLQSRVDAVQQPFDLLVNRYYEAQIAENVERGDIEVVDVAPVPLRPDLSRAGLNMVLALLVGLLVGGLGAALIEQLDSSIRNTGDAARVSDLAVIGEIPKLGTGGSTDLSESAWLGKEAFRGIRTYLRFAFTDPPQTLAVTSAGPSEGKSTIAVNLALTMVEQGSSVLIVDADLRRPLLHRILGVEQKPGLTDVLMGRARLADCIRPASSHPGLYVLPSGPATNNAAEILGGERFRELVEQLRDRFHTIVVDTPPLIVTDAALVGSVLDGTLIVARANRTEKSELLAALESLRRVGAPIAGIVLNDMHVDRGSYSRYSSYYAEEVHNSANGNGNEEYKLLSLAAKTAGRRSAS